MSPCTAFEHRSVRQVARIIAGVARDGRWEGHIVAVATQKATRKGVSVSRDGASSDKRAISTWTLSSPHPLIPSSPHIEAAADDLQMVLVVAGAVECIPEADQLDPVL